MNYVSECIDVDRFREKNSPTLKIVAELAKILVLEPILMYLNGVGNVLCDYDSNTGIFSFTTIQDTHTLNSFMVFEESLLTIVNGGFEA